MTQAQIFTKLKNTGYPVAYRLFSEPQQRPFIVCFFNGNSNIAADNTNYKTVVNLQVELYTDKKDLAAEAKLEQELTSIMEFYSKNEVYIPEEELFETIYESEVIIDG